MNIYNLIDLANALELNTDKADEAQEMLTSWVWERSDCPEIVKERTEKVCMFAPSFQAGYVMFEMED